ncbi:MAG: AgmX/PglI C-terminal domain-containing protein [candidate division KSB1 bacterium]|nr:AgmX/PglI C-terminal domain-containing protein [candidate division KSB1 bacterium]MDZ7335665.1 AgmX/PglI C-terminal domain-containing protein [candidate division KSB1 bacterium]MDZ7357716.1 AgmX/PglI C-terminal domain-containing protein [candidate division KSB1 bacterium]MDZ7375222.1 AgmX/PglI C-terminal domain-containing protein [candidate division KSB1 bacterium]MDZ7402042.1 AgmX/PglI C-terminal domain-containing protein [candidate division KSB1 bacterium]
MNQLRERRGYEHANNDQDWPIAIAGGLARLPKEYQRNLIAVIDKRFLLIWFMSFIIHFSAASYFALHPPETGYKQHEIDRIQKQFATYLLERTPQKLISEPALSLQAPVEADLDGRLIAGAKRGSSSGRVSNAGASGGSGSLLSGANKSGNGTPYGIGTSSRDQISQEVSSKGLLGLLTGSGSNAQGNEVADVLGEAGNNQADLDKVLGKLDGLKTSGRPGGSSSINPANSRITQTGSRPVETQGIEQIFGGKETIASAEIQRSNKIVLEQISEIADERGVKSQSRDPDQVSEVVNRHNASIQYCYQRELKVNPDLKGKLVVRFTIDPSGRVKDVNVLSSTLNSPSIERCVISRIKRWDDFGAIDPARGDAIFRQVYTFGY